jgi:acyl-CoA hydrolase
VGQVVRLRAEVRATFVTSMEIDVRVWGEDLRTGEQWPTVECLTTFVALDDAMKPTAIPPILLETPEDEAAQAAGEERRRTRLAKR